MGGSPHQLNEYDLRQIPDEERRRAARAVAWHYRDEILAGERHNAHEALLMLGLTTP